MKRKKKSPPKARNPYVVPAKQRGGAGKHKNKADKRADEDKRQDKYLDEDY